MSNLTHPHATQTALHRHKPLIHTHFKINVTTQVQPSYATHGRQFEKLTRGGIWRHSWTKITTMWRMVNLETLEILN